MPMQTLKFLGVLTVLATVGTTFVMDTYPLPAAAQTAGMTRRAERRHTRQTSREVKHECNAREGTSRSECRQAKHSTKQAGRNDELPSTQSPTTTPR